jgi:predicted nucleic acid-binding protein
LNVLVDTSVWSLSLRRSRGDLSVVERSLVAELTELIAEGRACLMGIVRQEILSGIRNPAQFEILKALLRTFPDVLIDTVEYEAAALASNQCRKRGVNVTVVDTLICATAAARGWAIFTADADFEHHARILPIQLHVPRM